MNAQRQSPLARLWPLLRDGHTWLLVVPLLVMAIAFFIPLGRMLLLSFQVSDGGITRWSLENYQKLFSISAYSRQILNTLSLGLIVTALCAVIGYPVAYFLTRGSPRMRSLVLIVIISPLLISLVARTFGWIVVLSGSGVLNNLLLRLGLIAEPIKMLFTLSAVVAGMIHIQIPYMILSISGVLADVDERLEDAAANLGASPLRTFWHVTLPLSLRGVLSGAVIVFGLTVSAYAIPSMLGGGKVRVMALGIYDSVFSVGDWNFAAALALVLLVIATILTGVSYTVAQRRA